LEKSNVRKLGSYLKLHKIAIILTLISIIFYVVFAYNLAREDFIRLIALYGALFFFFYKLIQFEKWNFKFLLVAGILFRLVFFWAEPNLSQDFYRFIWDGELIKNGLNPYLFTPNTLIEQPNLAIANATALYNGMGDLSARNYSNYPPLNQLIFSISAFLSGFFFVWAIYLIAINKWKLAAPVYACSIVLKLVPILFLPLFLKHFGFKKSIVFYALIGITCVLFLIPFISPEFFANYSKTVGLWFSNFEFNASVYNIVKKIGVHYFEAKPWELIKSYGSLISKLVVIIALVLTFLRKNQNLNILLSSMLVLLSSYYFLSSTVHPWYIIFLLTLSIFTNYRYPIVWSFVVILSYYAYSNIAFKENLGLIAIEYCLVLGYFIYEVFKNCNIKSRFRKKFNLK